MFEPGILGRGPAMRRTPSASLFPSHREVVHCCTQGGVRNTGLRLWDEVLCESASVAVVTSTARNDPSPSLDSMISSARSRNRTSARLGPRNDVHLGQRSKLGQQAQLIPIVPRLDNLSAGKTQDRNAAHYQVLAGGGNAHELTPVCHAPNPAQYATVALGNGFFHLDVHIGKGLNHAAGKFLESSQPDDLIIRRVAMGLACGIRQFIDGFEPLLVPHLFKPLAAKSRVFLRHNSPPQGITCRPGLTNDGRKREDSADEKA